MIVQQYYTFCSILTIQIVPDPLNQAFTGFSFGPLKILDQTSTSYPERCGAGLTSIPATKYAWTPKPDSGQRQ